MSGRQYDQPGIPICRICGSECLRCDETNFNGTYCKKCDEYVMADYDINHPIWIKYQRYMNSLQGKLVSFEESSMKNFKKRNGLTC